MQTSDKPVPPPVFCADDRQGIFDYVVAHLLQQNERSTQPKNPNRCAKNPNRCAYRGVHGLQCAVGCLIPDERYVGEIENGDASTSPVHEAIFGKNASVPPETAMLLFLLQQVHDSCEVASWKRTLKLAATEFNLAWRF